MFSEMHLQLIDFHMKNLERGILFFYNKKLKLLTNLASGILCVCFSACMIYPVIDTLFNRNGKVLTFACIVPFTDPHSNFGYFINLTNQSLLITYACYGYVIFLRLYLLMFVHLCVRVDVLVEVANELHGHIIECGTAAQNRVVTLKLTEIVQLHLEFLSFFGRYNVFARHPLFIQAISTVVQVALVLFVLSMVYHHLGRNSLKTNKFFLNRDGGYLELLWSS